jgi:5-methylcytosine-specific restriction endonuclease McrA
LKRSYDPHPKPQRSKKARKGRIRDTGREGAIARKLFQDNMCRGCGKRATTGHHIILRSQGGDDVEENIMPVEQDCHDRYHREGFLLASLRAEEYAYILSKLGSSAAADYSRRKYGHVEVQPK